MREAAGESVTWSDALIPSLVSAWLWIPLTMLALWMAARYPVERERWLLPVVMHILGALLVSVVRGAAVLVLNPWIGWYATIPPLAELFVTSLRNNVLIYWLLVGVGHGVHYARAVRAQREQLAQAQLHVLKSQLQPHFLFNALNTITAHIRTDPAAAERIVERLSQLLRNTLDSAAAQEVPLREELAALRPYLDIEQERFEERVAFHECVAPDTLEALVPHLLLQPLVENAVRHGLSRRAAGGAVHIAARRSGDSLEISVQDDGAGIPAGFRLQEHWGVGLRNTCSRLEQLYGAAHTFALTATDGGGAVARLSIPFRTGRSWRSA